MFAYLGIFPDDDGAEDKEKLVKLQLHWLNLNHFLVVTEHLTETADQLGDKICQLIPDEITVPPGVDIPNPAYMACIWMQLVVFLIGNAIVAGARTAYQVVNHQYEIDTMSDKEAYYSFYYSRATYHNTFEYGKKNWKALVEIHTDMMNQHTEMKRQLQERHKDIANHVGQDVSDLN